MKIITVFFLLLLCSLQYRLWIGNGSLSDVRNLEKKIQQVQLENDHLTERNLSLAAEVLDLKQGHHAIEERARSEMGMIKQDETFYQIVDATAAQQ